MDALTDSSEKNRLGAVVVLELLGPSAKAALPTLLQAVNDTDMSVRHAARHAIEAIQRRAP